MGSSSSTVEFFNQGELLGSPHESFMLPAEAKALSV